MAEDITGIGKVVSSLAQPIQGFLNAILGPASSEVGELIADNIKFVRWKNALKILEKAQKEMEIRGIQPKEIPLKILFPILEGASLESDDENLQAKWSNLLTSAAAGILSRPSHPKILSELIRAEAKILDYLYVFELRTALKMDKLKRLDQQHSKGEDYSLLRQKKREVIDSFDIPHDGFRLSKIRETLSFEHSEFSESIDNLLRLKLCKHPEEVSEVDVITSASLDKPARKKLQASIEDKDDYELDIDVESITNRIIDENSIRLTMLGISFMNACQPLS